MSDLDTAVKEWCTHVCRSRPSLKLSLNACLARKKAHDDKTRPSHKLDPYWECKGCEGAIPIEQAEKPKEEIARVEAKKHRSGACADCGRTPEETPFYPSRKERCKECIQARKAAIANGTLSIQPAESGETCMCKECGVNFKPWKNGGVTIKSKCKRCVQVRRAVGWHESLGESCVIRLDFERDKELLAAIGALAQKERRAVDQQILTILDQSLLTEERRP